MNDPVESQWPEHELETPPACPVCKSIDQIELHSGLKDLAFKAAPGTWKMQRCLACGSGYLARRPTSASIGRAYSGYYTHQESSEAKLERGRWTAFRNGYLNRRWNMHRQPASAIGGWLFPILNYWRFRSTQGQDFRDLDGNGQGRLLLDVGCGNGQFLSTAAEAGWKVEGIDFDPAAVAAATRQGLVVHLGGIEHYAQASNQFDEIMLSHVIEHVYDPRSLIADCHRLLKSGGRLWIETPNISSQGHRLMGAYWRGLEPPRHLVVFDRPALIDLMTAAGFREVRDLPWRPSFPWMFEVSSQLALADGQSLPYPRFRLIRKLIAELTNFFSPAHREFITLAGIK
ncbi:class I SAM-dependent methyltransferase [Nevskia ramosa]|uniref:class I SAM-dependent methyltransferase n=1 Tax=Nevskia ramosa TaxID=64002 RepID=UPI003D0AF52A